MKTVGLITEYNPYHNGHQYHLKSSLDITEATHSIAIMSGNFLQRGVPALVDKWTRTKMAIKGGVDLVIELPVIYATASAEYFSNGAIAHLNALGIVDSICFGSELGSVDLLKKISDVLINEPSSFKTQLKIHLNSGLPYAKARSEALKSYFNNDEIANIVSSPNNILGIEYIKALKNQNSNITPFTIKRLKADYHSKELEGNICSATAIRDHLLKDISDISKLKSFMPQGSFNEIESETYHTLEDYYYLLRYKIHTMSSNQLKNILDVSEGLENLLKSSIKKANNAEEFINLVISKRYTRTRIQRILIHILLDITEDMYSNNPKVHYIRVLGMNSKGKEILSKMRKTCDVPIINTLSNLKSNDEKLIELLNKDILATDIYMLSQRILNPKLGLDYTTQPYILSE